ncbi:MAG TPA: hypothetical protein VG123_06245 [Streptosporangiaceae bacterium]|nr:hypothetical protein [Streptosporangiaceae bacterium]
MLSRRAVALCLVLAAVTLAGCSGPGQSSAGQPGGRPVLSATGDPTFAALGQQAVRTLEQGYYTGAGTWHTCIPKICGTGNLDWGDDSLTYSLYFHWRLTHDPGVLPIMNALAGTANSYTPSTSSWSDVPMWDTIADVREYQVTGNPNAVAKAEAAFRFVAIDHESDFAFGACPSVFYQQPGGGNRLKTLETGSNYIKAALLLYQVTHFQRYLQQAIAEYNAVRAYFLSPRVPLYTVYVFDRGKACHQVPGRYFGSVNGNMIWAGYWLARATGHGSYLQQALATAHAVQRHLGDAAGVYADLQAENDISEPLVEAMYDLATLGHQGFARHWLLTAASAAAAEVTPAGTYGRFFDGPPPQAPVTVWQVNGGLTLEQAAAALDPGGRPARPGFWTHAVFVRHVLFMHHSPVAFTFTGRAVAIIGTIGEVCCEPGHARVVIDGTQTFDQTGIWQNKSSSGRSLPGSVLFAWRWPKPGRHTISIRPGSVNPKEGGPYFHMIGYDLVS